MSQPVYDVVCAGIVVADHVCAPVERMPASGELVLTERMELTVGGCASNAAVDLAKLGLRVAIVGTVGTDAFGRFCRRTLETAGVDCSHLGESATSETSATLVINTRGEDRRFIHSIGANREFTGREVSPDLIAQCRVLALGGYCLSETLSPKNVAEMFRDARNSGTTTVLDVVLPQPADYWPLLKPVLPLTDLFLPNEDEARMITGLNDPLEQAQRFRAAGAKCVVVTCGGEGAVLVDDKVRLRAGVHPVEYLDGTGSGDAFASGFIFGLLQGAGVEDCLRYGTALGANCVRATGATGGALTADELRDFVDRQELPIEEL